MHSALALASPLLAFSGYVCHSFAFVGFLEKGVDKFSSAWSTIFHSNWIRIFKQLFADFYL